MTHPPRPRRSGWPVAVLSAALVGIVVVGCGDDPFAFDWDDSPDTVTLYSLARPELNLVSGFGFLQNRRVRIESSTSSGQWDVAVDTRAGELVLLPPRALGLQGAARVLAYDGMTLDEVVEAPRDTTLYVVDQPVPLRLGTVYVVKTNRAQGSFGSSCQYHAKLEAVTLDVAGGVLVFRHVTNPVCNSVDLVPPR